MTNRSKSIQNTLKRLAVEYADDPNVQTIGFGLRSRGGKLEMERVIIFYVRRKYTSARQIEAAGSKGIPLEIDGFSTDVKLFDERPAAAGNRDETKFDPLLGGIMSSNSEGHIYWFNEAGTLGILVRDTNDGTPMALSNWHVWGDGGEEGDQIIQPGHPTGGDHVEAIGKVLACGPLITSLIEWEAPSPLTAGLYGGAAAAAVAAALSDYRDPTRRGQDNTLPEPDELTLRETVDVAIEYPQLPLPGLPFETNVKWQYTRETEDRLLDYTVEEQNTNTQFLLGKLVVTDKAHYEPGDTVQLTAAIWDYQPRPCDGYHVMAHLIAHNNPDTALRVVLHPTACPRTFPHNPPKDEQQEEICIVFDDYPLGQYPYKGAFAWLQYLDVGQNPVPLVDWFPAAQAIQLSIDPFQLFHAPTGKVVLQVAHFTNTPVTATAYNATGVVVDHKTAPQQQDTIHELVLTGNGIVSVILRGGGGEGLLISYCIEITENETVTSTISESLARSIDRELPHLNLEANHLRANRCCFTGNIALPPDENPGKWDVYLTVQNINHVPEGTPPEEAATVIGGHVLSAHTNAELLGCVGIMLLDHVFDVI